MINGDICYSDENLDIFYEGLLLDEKKEGLAYLVFFLHNKTHEFMIASSESVKPDSEQINFGAVTSFTEDYPAAYICGKVDISAGIPEKYECTFEYYVSKLKEGIIEPTIRFSVDPTKKCQGAKKGGAEKRGKAGL